MIYFVGMHNKPGMHPLDSRTRSGKIIDKIISELSPEICVKTNLSNEETLPENPEKHAISWHNRFQVKHGDVIVLLGRWVQENFLKTEGPKYIHCPHPASFVAGKSNSEYIENAVSKILKNND